MNVNKLVVVVVFFFGDYFNLEFGIIQSIISCVFWGIDFRNLLIQYLLQRIFCEQKKVIISYIYIYIYIYIYKRDETLVFFTNQYKFIKIDINQMKKKSS